MLPVALALLPVVSFLLVLLVIDSFKLVPTATLGRALAAGALAALAALYLHGWIVDAGGVGQTALVRYVAPVTEEALKALFVLYALGRRQIGFLVDAAILGFAIGAGFAWRELASAQQPDVAAEPASFDTTAGPAPMPAVGARGTAEPG